MLKNNEKLIEIAKDIRGIISDKQKELDLSFIEDTHTYYMRDLKGEIRSDYPSVSTVIKQFYNEFPDLEKSLEMSDGDIVKQDELLKQWRATADYANSIGSRTHFLLETDLLKLYGSYKDVRLPIFDCNEEQLSVSDKMIDAGHKFIQLMHRRRAVLLDTEMVLGSPELGYTGQPDKMWIIENEQGEIGFICTDWKGLPIDTPILTNNGWKNMGDLNINDKVYDKDGNIVSILNISKVKNKKCLKIFFDNNESIISDFEHRWLVYKIKNKNKIESVMTTQEIFDHLKNNPDRKQCEILRIENTKPLNNESIELPIDPYVLGVWLGDGHAADNKITQANELVWEEIKNRGYIVGKDVSSGESGIATTRTIHGLRSKLNDLNLLKNKHLPDIYLLSSYEQRLDLLRGLMDSDGTYNKKRNRFYVSTTRMSQVIYSTKIISSLGIKPTVIKYNKKLKDKLIICYNIEFTTDKFNPFLCRNQELISVIKNDRHTYRIIKKVEEVESVQTKCIEVDSPSSTYLFGHSLTITHNTNKPKNFEVQPYTRPMLPPFDDYMDTALSHYMIQLPLYCRLLLDMLKNTKYSDMKVFGCIIVHLLVDGRFVEYRIPKTFMNIVFTMDPLMRIDEIKRNKKIYEQNEQNRIKILNELINNQ